MMTARYCGRAGKKMAALRLRRAPTAFGAARRRAVNPNHSWSENDADAVVISFLPPSLLRFSPPNREFEKDNVTYTLTCAASRERAYPKAYSAGCGHGIQ
ncbi:hypothetical protein MRX96_002776 [Rhipicephalus microplus]